MSVLDHSWSADTVAMIQTCTIKGKKLKKDLYFSPVVGPGMARVVLTWGAAVKDLDSFMLTP
jgi:hypothetical protein